MYALTRRIPEHQNYGSERMEEKDKGGCNPSGRSYAAWEHGGGTDACGRRKRYLHKSQRDDEYPV